MVKIKRFRTTIEKIFFLKSMKINIQNIKSNKIGNAVRLITKNVAMNKSTYMKIFLKIMLKKNLIL
tara:strand:+ start:130 stop:327 length:198 start_codon:yes stop_codon:yes gene_type:complete